MSRVLCCGAALIVASHLIIATSAAFQFEKRASSDDLQSVESRPRIAVDGITYSQRQRLPKSNLGPVPADLTNPIGIPPEDQAVWAKLYSQRVTIDAQELPLAQVVERCSELSGLKFFVDDVAVNAEGVLPETPVTANVAEARLDHALNRLLASVNLTFVVRHGVVVVTSPIEAENQMVVRVYPVGDLVWIHGEGSDDAIDVDSLMDTIQQTISPIQWSSVGGRGQIAFFVPNLSLAILQSSETHQKIAELLSMLRLSRAPAEHRGGGITGQPPAIAQDPSGLPNKSATGIVGMSDEELKIRKALHDARSELNIVATPLADVAKALREISKLEIDIDQAALREEGIDCETLITLRLGNLPVDDALRLALPQYKLTWLIRNDVMVITSLTQAAEAFQTRCFPVGDLVTVSDGLNRWSSDHEDLVQLIESTVAPDSWSLVGGSGVVSYFPHSQCLAVSHNAEVQERVAEVLAMLRESRDRLPKLGRELQLPFPGRVDQLRLKLRRNEQASSEQDERKTGSFLSQSQQRLEDESIHPELAKQRVELHLLKAQVKRESELHQVQIDRLKAETSALKAQGRLAEVQANQLAHSNLQ